MSHILPFSASADTDGMAVHHVDTVHFQIDLYEQSGESGRQFVFIEGDGKPWSRSGKHPNSDPTPGRVLAYELMRRSPVRGFYITRPCYFGLGGNKCSPNIWTNERFAPIVTENMSEALKKVLNPEEPVTIVGYSGGAALAILIAQDLDAADSVIGIAGLADIEAWTTHHGYEALTGSANPASLTLREDINYLFLHGAHDRNIPIDQISTFATERSNVTLHRINDFDHTCCWPERWPTLWTDIVAPSLIPNHTASQ